MNPTIEATTVIIVAVISTKTRTMKPIVLETALSIIPRKIWSIERPGGVIILRQGENSVDIRIETENICIIETTRFPIRRAMSSQPAPYHQKKSSSNMDILYPVRNTSQTLFDINVRLYRSLNSFKRSLSTRRTPIKLDVYVLPDHYA